MKSLKKFLSVFLACLMAFGVMSASVFAEDIDTTIPSEDTTVDGGETTDPVEPADELITAVDLTVAAPIDGEYATGTCVIDTLNTALNFIQWVDADTDDVLYSSNANDTVVEMPFMGGFDYTVNLIITAGEGYAFAAEGLAVTVNGNAAEIADLSEDGKELAISYTFTCEAIGGDDDEEPAVTFDQVLNFLKTLLVTFIRFLGSLVGIG